MEQEDEKLTDSLPEIESEEIQNHPLNEELKQLRTMWQVPFIYYFCDTFVEDGSEFEELYSIEELEEALQNPDSELLAAIHVYLLKGVEERKISIVKAATWKDQIRFEFSKFHRIINEYWEENPFQKDISYSEVSVENRVKALYLLCEFNMDQNLKLLEYMKTLSVPAMRLEPLGSASNKLTYWYFGDNRLYSEYIPPKSNSRSQSKSRSGVQDLDEKPEWKIACSSILEWQNLIEELKTYPLTKDKNLVRKVSKLLPEIEEIVQQREEEIQKKQAELQRKRSTRLQAKEIEKFTVVNSVTLRSGWNAAEKVEMEELSEQEKFEKKEIAQKNAREERALARAEVYVPPKILKNGKKYRLELKKKEMEEKEIKKKENQEKKIQQQLLQKEKKRKFEIIDDYSDPESSMSEEESDESDYFDPKFKKRKKNLNKDNYYNYDTYNTNKNFQNSRNLRNNGNSGNNNQNQVSFILPKNSISCLEQEKVIFDTENENEKPQHQILLPLGKLQQQKRGEANSRAKELKEMEFMEELLEKQQKIEDTETRNRQRAERILQREKNQNKNNTNSGQNQENLDNKSSAEISNEERIEKNENIQNQDNIDISNDQIIQEPENIQNKETSEAENMQNEDNMEISKDEIITENQNIQIQDNMEILNDERIEKNENIQNQDNIDISNDQIIQESENIQNKETPEAENMQNEDSMEISKDEIITENQNNMEILTDNTIQKQEVISSQNEESFANQNKQNEDRMEISKDDTTIQGNENIQENHVKSQDVNIEDQNGLENKDNLLILSEDQSIQKDQENGNNIQNQSLISSGQSN